MSINVDKMLNLFSNLLLYVIFSLGDVNEFNFIRNR